MKRIIAAIAVAAVMATALVSCGGRDMDTNVTTGGNGGNNSGGTSAGTTSGNTASDTMSGGVTT